MGAEDNGLTLEGLAHKLEALTEKLGGQFAHRLAS